MQTLRQSFASNPLLQIATAITIVVGLLTILERVGKFGVGIYRNLSAAVHWYRDRQLFHYMTVVNPRSLYEVKELAKALQRSPSQIVDSLHRLRRKKKVRCMEVNESPFGLWGVHEFQE